MYFSGLFVCILRIYYFLISVFVYTATCETFSACLFIKCSSIIGGIKSKKKKWKIVKHFICLQYNNIKDTFWTWVKWKVTFFFIIDYAPNKGYFCNSPWLTSVGRFDCTYRYVRTDEFKVARCIVSVNNTRSINKKATTSN